MNCEQAAEFVSSLFDGERIPREAAEHIGCCEACCSRMRDYAAMRAELQIAESTASWERVPEGRWIEIHSRNTNWLSKWRETMRIPRFAFVLMMVLILILSGGLALVKARPRGNGPSLLLTIKLPPNGAVLHCTFDTRVADGHYSCSHGASIDSGYVWISARYMKREADRVQLAIKTKYSSEPTPQQRSSDVLADIPEEEYWFNHDRVLAVQVAGLGTIEISGQFLDYMPAVGSRPTEPLDAGPDEFRLYYPVLARENRVLVNITDSMVTYEGNDAAAALYAPGLGRFIFSSVPLEGAVEGKRQFNQLSFTLNGQPYLLVTGAPISRAERLWVLLQPNWRPSQDEPRVSDDRATISGSSLQHLLKASKR